MAGHPRRPLAGSLALVTALAAVLAACGDSGSGGSAPAGSGSASVSAPAGTSAAPAAPSAHAPRRAEGSAAALSMDGERLFIADEDHEVVFVVPAAFTGPTSLSLNAVPMPGPPAQIVAAGDLVLITVRTLPVEAAVAARAEVRGPLPDPTKARRLASSDLKHAWEPEILIPRQYSKLLEDPSAPPAGTAAPGSAASGAPSAAPSGSATASTTATAKPAQKPQPRKPFDPSIVRKSQGGLLLVMKPDPERGLIETGRILLPADAWGLAVTPDGRRAVVTSAWASRISVVDINEKKVIADLPAAREPRGVTITKDGKTAYITHLMGAALTKIDGLDATPTAAAQPFPSALARLPDGVTGLHTSQGYAITQSPDGESLYVPRHAIGAEAHDAWWGAPVVDVLDRRTGKPIAPQHRKGSPSAAEVGSLSRPEPWEAGLGRLPRVPEQLVQPRAALYRPKTDTLIIAGEGTDSIVELDALAPDPAMFTRRSFRLGVYDEWGHQPVRGGAPAGLALSDDGDTLYVYCRTTYDLVKIDLNKGKSDWLRLAEDNLPPAASKGRRLFTNATSMDISGGLGCASCHPEGRDDGHTWLEALLDDGKTDDAVFIGERVNFRSPISVFAKPRDEAPVRKFYPRQTPMIAGRARSEGPYGWHAEAADLIERLKRGFRLHRASWQSFDAEHMKQGPLMTKIEAIRDYLRFGLLPPPVVERPLTDQEKRGMEVFSSDQAQCAKCHVPANELTDRTAYPLKPLPVLRGFDDEKNASFKTPSLLFIAGTAPYFHDGSQATLEDLVKNNGSRMGQTAHLSPDEQAALVAYLRTL